MSATADQMTVNLAQDEKPTVYSQATHSAFFQGKNLGLFSGEKLTGKVPSLASGTWA